MRKSVFFVSLALMAFFATSAHALVLYPTSNPQCTSNNPAASGEAGYINTCFGTSFTNDDRIYRQNVGGSEEGGFAGSYTTTFYNSPLDPMDANVVYDGGPSIQCASALACILAIKDGNHSPAYYFFDLSYFGWNGTESIELRGFWPNRGAISHVSIWGTSRSVPEPGTLALMGLGLAGLGFGLRRRRPA